MSFLTVSNRCKSLVAQPLTTRVISKVYWGVKFPEFSITRDFRPFTVFQDVSSTYFQITGPFFLFGSILFYVPRAIPAESLLQSEFEEPP